MGFIINPYRYASGGGEYSGACNAPNVTYTWPNVAPYSLPHPLSHEITTGCFLKPIVKATSITHDLASDDDLRFWINCKPTDASIATYGPSDTSHGGNGCNYGANNLLEGYAFTKTELIAGIDLNDYDSTNAAEQDSSDSTELGWTVFIQPYDISDCPAVNTACLGASTVYGLTAQAWWMGSVPSVYTGSGTFPQFRTLDSVTTSTATGTTSNYVLQVAANVEYFADSSSLGEDTFGATDFKIEIQYDTSCDTSGGCGSYSWTDGIDNDTFLAAGTGGIGNEQTFDVVEADCWNEEYVFVRYRIIAQGSCNSTLTNTGAWSTSYLGEFDVVVGGVECGGGGGGPPPP